ncbi:flagellar assembly protein FliW [Pseudarthrobacter sp. 1G09]|uniref:flagellar assembly protein FliW n=1 Tax=Pseudarthrobacter sp. 1G09 TaxID=3416178 RepID=UPI003CF6333A
MSTITTMPVTFTTPMPGLESLDSFTLRSVDGALGLFALEAHGGAALRLFLADAVVYAPGYSPAIPPDATAAGQTTTLLVVNPGDGKPTVNLAAPLVLNPETGLCTQLILDSTAYPLQAELGGKQP